MAAAGFVAGRSRAASSPRRLRRRGGLLGLRGLAGLRGRRRRRLGALAGGRRGRRAACGRRGLGLRRGFGFAGRGLRLRGRRASAWSAAAAFGFAAVFGAVPDFGAPAAPAFGAPAAAAGCAAWRPGATWSPCPAAADFARAVFVAPAGLRFGCVPPARALCGRRRRRRRAGAPASGVGTTASSSPRLKRFARPVTSETAAFPAPVTAPMMFFGFRAMWESFPHGAAATRAARPGRRRRSRAPRRRSAAAPECPVGPRSSPQARRSAGMALEAAARRRRRRAPEPAPTRRRSRPGPQAAVRPGAVWERVIRKPILFRKELAALLISARRGRTRWGRHPKRAHRPGGWRATKPPLERISLVQREPVTRGAGGVEADARDLEVDVAGVGVDRHPLALAGLAPGHQRARRPAGRRAGRPRRARTRRSPSSRSPCPATCRGRRPTCTACGRSSCRPR